MSVKLKQKKPNALVKAAARKSVKVQMMYNTLTELERQCRFQEMAELGEQYLIEHPEDETFLLGAGFAHRQLGNHNQAICHFNRLLEINPANAIALFHIGMIMAEHEQYDHAIGLFESALQHDPDYEPPVVMLQNIFARQQDFVKLTSTAMYALKRFPKRHGYWLNLDQGLSHLASYLSYESFPLTKDFQDFVITQVPFLDQTNHGLMSVCIKQLLSMNPAFNTYLRQVNQDGAPALIEAAEKSDFLNTLYNPLFIGLLDATRANSLLFENLLQAIRYALLRAAIDTGSLNLSLDKEGQAVVSRLAKYFFRIEYLPDVTSEEQTWLGHLERKLTESSFQDLEPVTASTLAMLYGMYHPLYDLRGRLDIDSLRKAAKNMKPIHEVIKIIYDNLEEEERIKSSIKVLGSLQNTVSQKVQEQYEEHPYPRWHVLPPFTPTKAAKFLDFYAPMHKAAHIQIPSRPEILIAGCGTGQQTLSTGCTLPSATVLNVDLSKSSLAYAIRKTSELGLMEQHDFMQADILQLGALNRQFDIVECCGVLHHMEDPLAGWRVLTDLVRPGGLMEIALYSRSAREQIVQMREQIRQKGYPETLESLRQIRKECIKNRDNAFVHSVDFFSTSALRDLIFHRNEHQFTIPQIQSCLQELGLKFIGFHNSDIYERYMEVFPSNRDYENLDNWQIVEEKYPTMFFGMYQFICHKPA